MENLLNQHSKLLMEGAIVERLRRDSQLELHPDLLNTPLIYSAEGRQALLALYQEYVDIAVKAGLPILLGTPTWKSNEIRVKASSLPLSINQDAVHFLHSFRESQLEHRHQIKIGGLLGCKNDCYTPQEALSVSEAQAFHAWQIEQLAMGEGIDYLMAATLPNVDEALGIAQAMEQAKLPYIISFVISRDGRVLDGHSLTSAIRYIDENTSLKPMGYMVNCAFPAFINPQHQPKALFTRLIGCQANASSLDHCDLDKAEQLEMDSLSEWGGLMRVLHQQYQIKILGGCCGTNGDHLRELTC